MSILLPLFLVLLPGLALAQEREEDEAPEGGEAPDAPEEPEEPEAPSSDEPPPPEVSPDELAAIEAALAADTAALQAAGTLPPEPPPAAPPGRGGGGSMNPDLSFILDVAGAAFSDPEPLQGGAHDPVVDGVNLQQLELAIGGAVDPYLRFDGNLVFAQFGVELEEAYATTTSLPGRLQLRAGQFLTRFGRFNVTHPHSWSFVDQPFALSRIFGGEGNRGLGAEASVLLPLPWYAELLASETMANGAATARSFYGGQDLGVDSPLHLQSTVALKQFHPLGPDWALMWGLSWASGPNPTGRDNRTEVYGGDLLLKWRPVTRASHQELRVHAEGFWRRRQVPEDVYSDTDAFALATWRFARRWGLGARAEWGSMLTNLDGDRVTDELDPEWTNVRTRLSGQTTFWPTEFSRLRLQLSRDAPAWRLDPVLAAFLALEVSVGAHGAHSY